MSDLDVSIVVATFEGPQWRHLARLRHRALTSARQFGVPVVDHHGGATLAEARNAALDQVQTEWLIYLDADDELHRDYLTAMGAGSADVRAPRCLWMPPGMIRTSRRATFPKVTNHQHDCVGDCLREGNWLVIGAMVRTEIAQKVRWQDWPVLEDFDFWLRCYVAGATFEAIPGAMYLAHSQRGGRNMSATVKERNAVHQQIIDSSGLA